MSFTSIILIIYSQSLIQQQKWTITKENEKISNYSSQNMHSKQERRNYALPMRKSRNAADCDMTEMSEQISENYVAYEIQGVQS
jgi:hypothetical protein